MEKQYRHLINNEVFGSDKQMPRKTDFYFYNEWFDSLVKLECSESLFNDLKTYSIDFELHINSPNPIDITSITTVKDGKVSFKEVDPSWYTKESMKAAFDLVENARDFKEVECESNDVWIEFEQAISVFTKEFVKVHEVAPHPFDVMFWLKENKQFTITQK